MVPKPYLQAPWSSVLTDMTIDVKVTDVSHGASAYTDPYARDKP